MEGANPNRFVVSLIPVHNAEGTIEESFRSTKKRWGMNSSVGVDHGVVVLNNCSDQTESRIRKVLGEGPMSPTDILEESAPGIVPALNRGLIHILSKFGDREDLWIARQDGDDIWEPEKLKKQHEFLDAHPEVDILGTQIQPISQTGGLLSPGPPHPLMDREIKAALLNGHNAINHPSVMFRASILKYTGLYDNVFPMAEDLHLWLKASMRATFANLPDRLVRYRQVHNPSYNPASPQVAGFCYQVIYKNGLGNR